MKLMVPATQMHQEELDQAATDVGERISHVSAGPSSEAVDARSDGPSSAPMPDAFLDTTRTAL